MLLLVYAAGLVFYLFSWETISSSGIEEQLLWWTRKHSYQDIASLQFIGEGERSDRLKQDGPYYSITLRSGRYITLELANEGMTPEELRAIAGFISERSGLEWVKRPDARPR